MTKKLDQIRERRAKLEAELTQLAAEEKRAAKHAQRQRERRIIRAMRQSGVLAREESVVLQEIAVMRGRLEQRVAMTASASTMSVATSSRVKDEHGTADVEDRDNE